MEVVAKDRRDRLAGHRCPVGPSPIRAVLVVEVAGSRWTAARIEGPAQPDTPHAGRQPDLGRTVHGEFLKLGFDVSQATVAKYLRRRATPPSQTWRTFLANHASQIASIDFFTVPTATVRVLFVFVVLSHDRRRIVHVNVTSHPTAAWTAQQLREAWPTTDPPRFVLRDRDSIYGDTFRAAVEALGSEEVVTAPRSPWQNPFVERVIGTLRRECVDHVIVWNERALRRVLRAYVPYYHDWRTHLSLGKDAPHAREVDRAAGPVVAVPHVGGLHHHYERRAA
jgi:putative transposase